MNVIQEHSLLPEVFNPECWNDKIKDGYCLNPMSTEYEKKFFFVWNSKGKPGYYSTFVIGAQYVEGKPLVVTTKNGCDNIDFLKIFSTCFFSGIESDSLNKIYDLDFRKPRIKTEIFSSVLTPLIVVHYLSIMRIIIAKELKKDYINRVENLKKVKGKISIYKNDRVNIINRRFDRVYCSYQDYSINTIENRLLKRALIFSIKVLQLMGNKQTAAELIHVANIYLRAFEQVDDKIDIWEVKNIKKNKLYSEYCNAIELAKIILQKFDYSITQIGTEEKEVPSFWIDMSLLYEHYILGLLKEAYHGKIIYQFKGNTGYPDFLYKSNDSDETGIILDSKYIPRLGHENIDVDIIRQLSGYARDRKILKELGANNNTIIPCVIIYPDEDGDENPFKNSDILSNYEKEVGVNSFYKIGVPFPKLNL